MSIQGLAALITAIVALLGVLGVGQHSANTRKQLRTHREVEPIHHQAGKTAHSILRSNPLSRDRGPDYH